MPIWLCSERRKTIRVPAWRRLGLRLFHKTKKTTTRSIIVLAPGPLVVAPDSPSPSTKTTRASPFHGSSLHEVYPDTPFPTTKTIRALPSYLQGPHIFRIPPRRRIVLRPCIRATRGGPRFSVSLHKDNSNSRPGIWTIISDEGRRLHLPPERRLFMYR